MVPATVVMMVAMIWRICLIVDHLTFIFHTESLIVNKKCPAEMAEIAEIL
jgi:hypothetical protein